VDENNGMLPEEEQPKTTRRQRWKAAKKKHREEKRAARAAKKAARKEYYKDAPWLIKAWNFWLRKLIIILVILALVVQIGLPLFFSSDLFVSLVLSYIAKAEDEPVDKETIYAMSPLDEEGGARIDALAPYDENETWGIYVYMVGSNLEDQDENDLSDLTWVNTSSISEENAAIASATRYGYLDTFISELRSNGLDMPEYLYRPDIPTQASSTYVTQDVVVATSTGAASSDIAEMTSGVWSDNISIVIQTGGATHWTNSMVNPNKTQRFLYSNGVFSEVSNVPLEDSCAPETLAEFMQFCEDNYPADHKILVLWDHGGGVAGYGNDSIFSSALSLGEIREAFEAVYTPSASRPAYDIIGFDACLMASAEVAQTLDGFGKYLVASEEVEPGQGWDYSVWLQAMTDDPTMNAAQIGRSIADSFMDFYMAYNSNLGALIGNQEVTMSVTDIHKASQAYSAYCKLCRAQLKDAASDMSVLADIGSKAGNSTRYGGSVYDIFNTVDLGGYMDLLDDTYPNEAQTVRTLLKDAVLYHRQSEGLADSQGLSVYVPIETSSFSGLMQCIKFIYETSTSVDVSALYYYKLGGCLNEELSEYVTELSGTEPQVLDVSVFDEISLAEPAIEDGYWSIPVDTTLMNMIQSSSVEIAYYDEENNSVTYYGRDEYAVADGEGSLANEFTGEWATLDGVPLATEIVSSSPSSIEYRSKVQCDGEDYYLMFTYSRDTEEYSISGLKQIQTGDDAILMINTRQLDTVAVGKKIVPVYSTHSFVDGSDSEITGEAVRITSRSKISLDPLPDGEYLTSIVISDPRGDSYYSPIIEEDIDRGAIVNMEVRRDFYGTD
jgi:hypothetical protein